MISKVARNEMAETTTTPAGIAGTDSEP